jgi:photosystem II stability/assembly factor-like uncharacterized protein
VKFRYFSYFLAAAFCLLLSSASFAAWQKQKSGTLSWLHGVYFFDEKYGFVVGTNGTILRTTDGGVNWTKADSPAQDNFRDIVFLDEQIGWILCERNIFKLKAGESRSYLLRTRDGGETWLPVNFPKNAANTAITRFILSNDGKKLWAVGEVGTLYALDGSGLRWLKKETSTRYLLNGGAFLDENTGWLVGAGATLLATADGGAVWHDNSRQAEIKPRFNSAFFSSPKQGWIVGTNGKILVTTNGGKSWSEQNSGTDAGLTDVKFVSDQTGFAVGEGGTVLSTKNGGTNWEQEKVNASHRLERLFFKNEKRGWAVGFGGTILSYSKN